MDMQSSVPYPWKEEYGEIHFYLTHKNQKGREWIGSLKKMEVDIGENARELLLPIAFFSVKAGSKSKIILLEGSQLCGVDNIINIENVLIGARDRHLIQPNPEVACLISQNFTSKDIRQMGFEYLCVMHEPIIDHENDRMLFGLNCHGERIFLNANINKNWSDRTDKIGFAFEVPE